MNVFFVNLSLKKILQSNEDLKFNVKLQKCIEYIRSNKIDEAILFAREELVPLIEQNVKWKMQQEKRVMETHNRLFLGVIFGLKSKLEFQEKRLYWENGKSNESISIWKHRRKSLQ